MREISLKTGGLESEIKIELPYKVAKLTTRLMVYREKF
jgi:hypothetical protein